MSAIAQKLDQMDALYQSERKKLLAQIAADNAKQQAMAEEAAERLGQRKAQKRHEAVMAIWEHEKLPEHQNRVAAAAESCRQWRSEFREHLDALTVLIDRMPELQSAIESILLSAATEAYIAYSSNPNANPNMAWMQAQDLVNHELAGEHDLSTASAVSVARDRLCARQLRQSVMSVQSNQYGEPPPDFKKLDVAQLADQWLDVG